MKLTTSRRRRRPNARDTLVLAGKGQKDRAAQRERNTSQLAPVGLFFEDGDSDSLASD